MGTIKFRATNEDVNLTKVGLVMTKGSASNLASVGLYNGSTLVGTVNFGQTEGAVATSTLFTPLKLTANQDVILTIKADLAAIGSGQSGTEGILVRVEPLNAEGSGLSSGTTLKVSSTGTVNGVRTFKSFPTIASDSSLGTTGLADGKLMRFKITADPKGPVGIFQLTFKIATSGTATAVSATKLYVFTDAAYSSPASTVATGGLFDDTINGTTGNVALASSPTIAFQALTNAIEIPAGSTYYFELDATVGGVAAGSSVTTTLLGSSAYIAQAHLFNTSTFVSSTTGAVADGANFIWSGNATTTANITTDTDWANGFGIVGLPSAGISTTRSQ
jgi:hypothetical protein